MIAFLLCILASFLVGDLLHRRGASAELSRKSVHVCSCLLICAYPAFGIDERTLFRIAIGSALALSLLRGSVLMRAIMSVERESYGDLLLPASVAIATAIGVSYPAFFAAYLVLGISDALAGLVGRAYGCRRYCLLGHAKTYLGSTAFFLSGLAILTAVGLWLGLAPLAALIIGGVVGAALTLIEACCHKGLDNLCVPLATALSLQAWLSTPMHGIAAAGGGA